MTTLAAKLDTRTPAAAPSPTLTPIQYQPPIVVQRTRGALPSVLSLVPEDRRPLLVFFTSRRSGPARRMESLLAHIARKERASLRVRRVNVDERPDVAKRFSTAEVGCTLAVDHAVVERDGDVPDAAHDDLPVPNDRPLPDPVDPEDRNLRMVEWRRGQKAGRLPGARNGEGAASQLLRRELAFLRSFRKAFDFDVEL